MRTSRAELEARRAAALRQYDEARRPLLDARGRYLAPAQPMPAPRPVLQSALVRVLPWLPAAAVEVSDHLRAFAARYPERFEYRDGKLHAKRRER